MRDATPKTIRLEDYTPPPYLIDSTELRFDLGEEVTRVHSRLVLRRNPAHPGGAGTLVLDGQDLVLEGLVLDGRPLATEAYRVEAERLVVPDVPDAFVLEVDTAIRPQDNTALEGLYKSSGNFCTQCEAEGFRRITYYLDRPDVMARFTTTITAERARYPVLLSNGNQVEAGELPEGRHFARWEDPFPKPCYLFALVAGDLVRIADTFTTASGRSVDLHLYVEARNQDKCEHAMRSLKKAMRWDEQRFGREYDLDVYMIVAVDDFNMGAMENKGLNVFNSKYVLARPDTATDDDYEHIESVIAHEYFHNWSGNRVTCRDWFQLSLKEGFTVFRDQEFTADMTSRAVKRIQDANLLRTHQFREDAGPLAHPVRPEAYQEINNFYTLTVYEKGAEVVRMVCNLLGWDAFRKGTDLYFERHDGQAVTTDDFIRSMEDASGVDLTQFRRWYGQAGTPRLTVSAAHDPTARTYALAVRQHTAPTPGQAEKAPLHIPFAVGLLDVQGRDLPLRLAGEQAPRGTHRVLHLCEAEHAFVFQDVERPPVPSLLRGFSAPVKLDFDYSDADLAFLMAHDSDDFNRWDAGQRLAVRLAHRRMAGEAQALDANFVAAFRKLLGEAGGDRRLQAQALTLPSEAYLAETMDVVDPEAIHAARQWLRAELAGAARDDLLAVYRANSEPAYRVEAEAMGKRRLKNLCLGYLMALDDEQGRELAMAQFRAADNMTDQLAALRVLADRHGPQREEALDAFYQRWQSDPLVVDKWLGIQATSSLPDTLERVRGLTAHPAFNLRNPNKVRALIGAFCAGNPARFHAGDGAGYGFLGDWVLRLDPLNPQVAARLLGPMSHWRRYDAPRQALMKARLQRILAEPKLSRDVYEIASKSLGNA